MTIKSPGIYLLFVIFFMSIAVSSIRAADKELPYNVIFKGVSDKILLSDIQSISDTYNNNGNRIASSYLLQKIAESDMKKFLQLLKARGFYSASIKSEINAKEKSLELTFIFQTGKPFLLKSVQLEFTEESLQDAPKLPNINKLGLYTDQPFSSQSVLEGQDELIRIIRGKGFPFAKISDREVLVDHKDQSVSVNFSIDTGPRAFFGDTVISGLAKVDESYIMEKIPWKNGDVFNGDLIEKARNTISGLGLFSSVRITEGTNIDESSMISITIDVAERKHRSIGIGVKYLSDEGPGGKISWEHRNIFDHGEKLNTYLELSEYTTASETDFRRQDFLITDQSLRLSLRLSKYHPEAYESTSIISSGYIDRDLTEIFRIGGGLVLKSSKIDQLGTVESYYLSSLPVYFSMDKSNDILDPVIGYRALLQLTPYYQISGDRITFGKALASYKRYIRISRRPLIVIAANITASVIKGASRADIPADERLYSGGGGSIRGYSYQSVGPLSDGVPIGGKSLFECSIEFRFKVSDRFGITAFYDGGSAFTEDMFAQETPLRWGTGLGLRYYTPIGPFRLDVGIPLNKRKGIDDSFQIYISLGQAF